VSGWNGDRFELLLVARRLRERLREVEWEGTEAVGPNGFEPACPCCLSLGPTLTRPLDRCGHRPDCSLAADLAEADRVLGAE